MNVLTLPFSAEFVNRLLGIQQTPGAFRPRGACLKPDKGTPEYPCQHRGTGIESPEMIVEYDMVGEEHIRREKEAARRLRKTQWWRNRIGRGVCHYCQLQVGKDQLTMDHVVPLSRGGRSKKGNVVPCCKECNNRKKSMLPIEWEEYLRSIADRDSET